MLFAEETISSAARVGTSRTACVGEHLDRVPFSGIIRIRDMMYSVEDPFRLDQGDVSFDAPDTVKAAMRRAIDENTATTCRRPASRGCSSSSPRSCGARTASRSARPTR